jgi:PKD repeat protein
MKLYVDGNVVASNPAVTKAQVYRGYWRLGGDNTDSWPNAPTTEAINASIDEAAVYPTALSLAQVRAHLLASGRSIANVPPVASFTSSNVDRTATLTSTSTDVDGTIVTWAWNFGDSTTGSGASTTHPYAAGGTYPVTLTVTDNNGGTNTIVQNVTVTDPPPNVPPVASFTSSNVDRTATVVSTSTDSDGSIVSWAWSFGDTTSGSGATTSHLYAAAGTYPVTLTVTDNNGGTNAITQNVTVTDPAPINYALDPFTRVVANGFGTATVGGPWSLSGAAASFSVNGTVGRIAGVLSANRSAYLATVVQHDMDITADVAIDRAATGGGVYVSVIGRRASAGNDYHVKLRYLPGGSVTAYLVRNVGNVETILATAPVTGVTVAPGDVLRVRLQVSGAGSTTVQAKVWPASAVEPVTWLTTDTSAAPAVLQGTGDVGVLLYTSGSWTGALPTLSLDNFRVGPIAP